MERERDYEDVGRIVTRECEAVVGAGSGFARTLNCNDYILFKYFIKEQDNGS